MSRSRNIKPGFFRNADLVELRFEARLLFIGLWTIADRLGRLEDRPKQIKMELFPADNLNCDELLNELAVTGMLVRYEVESKRYLQVTNFCKHQNPHRDEKESIIPAPCLHDASTVQEPCKDDAGTMGILLIPDSLLLIPESLVPSSDAGASVVASSALAPCPHQEILELYANELPDLAQPRVWKGQREVNLRARWAWVLADLKKKGRPHDKAAGLEFFQRMFAYVSKSDFLMGRKTDWSCSLPWIVGSEHFAKIIEGTYENKEAA